MIEKRVHHAASKIKTSVTVGTSRRSATVAPGKGNARSLKSGITYKRSYENTENDEKLRNESREDNNAASQINTPSEPKNDIRPDMSFGASNSANAACSVKRTRLSRKRLGIRRGAFRKARQKLQHGLRSANDTGSENISMSIDSAVTGVKVYSGTRAVTGRTIKTGVAVVKTAPKVKHFISNMGRAKVVRYKYSISGKTAVRTKTGVAGVRSNFKGASSARPSERTAAAKKSHVLSVGRLNAKTAEKFARMQNAYKKGEASAALSDAIAKADRIVARKKVGKASLKVGGKILKTGSRAIKTGVLYSADYTLETLEHSADLGTQAFAAGVKGTKYAVKGIANTPKTIKTGYKAVKTVVLFPIKTSVAVYHAGKNTVQAAKTLKSMGAKNATAHLRQKLYASSIKVAKAAAKITGRILLSLTTKVALPLIVICAVMMSVSSMASTGVTFFTTVFGETFSIKGQNEDLDVREYLREAVEHKKTEFVSEIMKIESDNLVSNDENRIGGEYHIVRLFANNDIGQVDFSSSGILKTVASTEDFITTMSPTFKTILFAAYGLDPTQDELDALIGDMWRVLVKTREEALPMEYCMKEVDEETGDEYYIAYENCPNKNRLNPRLCDWHKILGVTVIQGGYFELVNSFFMNEITALEGLLFRNEHQEERLSELTDMHELYRVYMQEEVASHGGLPDFSGIPPEALEDEMFARLMEEATKYLGYPYVFGGSTPATSFDCSGFVSWVYTVSGVYDLPRITAQGMFEMTNPITPLEAKPGDLIFFTSTSSHTTAPVTHLGIYIGSGKMVHAGDPIGYANITDTYWQSHFYSFGRLNIE